MKYAKAVQRLAEEYADYIATNTVSSWKYVEGGER